MCQVTGPERFHLQVPRKTLRRGHCAGSDDWESHRGKRGAGILGMDPNIPKKVMGDAQLGKNELP